MSDIPPWPTKPPPDDDDEDSDNKKPAAAGLSDFLYTLTPLDLICHTYNLGRISKDA